MEDMELKLCEYKYRFKKKHIHNGLGRGLLLREANDIYDPYFDELYEMLSDRDKCRGDVKSEYQIRKKGLAQQFLAGKQFMDFTLIDSLGNEKRISDYVGKNELLFWIFGQAGVVLVVLKNHVLSGYIRNIKIEGLAFWGFH